MNDIKSLKIELVDLQLQLANANYDERIEAHRKKINGHNVGILIFILQLAGLAILLFQGKYPENWLTMILIVFGVGVFAMIRLVVLISKAKQNISDIEFEKETTIQRIGQLQKEVILAE